MMAVLLAAGSLLAQPQPNAYLAEQDQAAQQADTMKRAALAESLVGTRELPGQEFEASFRRELVERLSAESIEQLELRQASGDLTISANALGDSRNDLTYTTLAQPCRIIDTRPLIAGRIAAGSSRDFEVAGISDFESQGGTAGGCGIPLEATVVMMNFVAVSPLGGGNLTGAAYPNSLAGAGSILNYQLLSPPLNIANGVLFPICDVLLTACPVGMTLQANISATHVVVDVLGYAMRFPKQRVKNILVQGASGDFTASVTIGSTCTNYPGANVSITAPVAGQVWIHSTVVMYLYLGAATSTNGSDYEINIADSPTYCNGSPTNSMGTVSTQSFKRRGRGISTGLKYLLLDAVVSIEAGATMNLTLNGKSYGEEAGDEGHLNRARIIAQFIPD
jgi:hypothetical protein